MTDWSVPVLRGQRVLSGGDREYDVAAAMPIPATRRTATEPALHSRLRCIHVRMIHLSRSSPVLSPRVRPLSEMHVVSYPRVSVLRSNMMERPS